MPTYYERSCSWAAENELVEDTYQWPVISGEWSLAIDTCAMWLLGFNDMQPGEPRAICDMVELPPCYMGDDQPGCPLDLEEGLQGPFGSGISSPMVREPPPPPRCERPRCERPRCERLLAALLRGRCCEGARVPRR